MDSSLEEKQEFLRSSILNPGYDADEFMAFLQEKKGEEGMDLNNWLITELQDAVYEFTSLHQPRENQEEENQNYENDYNENQNIYNNDNNYNDNNYNDNYDNNNNINNNINNINNNNNDFEQIKFTNEFVECSKTEVSTLSTRKNITVNVAFPEKKEGGIFSKSYITYLVDTKPWDFKSRKRYSDFEWLRNILNVIYTNQVIPPMPKKNYKNRFNEDFISKRMRGLEKFLQGLVIHPVIKHSEILSDFLCLKEKEFDKKKPKYKFSTPTNIKQIKSLTGSIDVGISKEKQTYFENIKGNAYLNETNLQKITKAYNLLITTMYSVSNQMKNISLIWKEINDYSVKYNESYNTSETYKVLTKLMESWSDIEKEQANLLNLKIREYFRYIKNEFHSLELLSNKVDTQKSIYSNALEKLYKRKESLFASKEIEKWGLQKQDLEDKLTLFQDKDKAFSKMLPLDTQTVNNYKSFYGMFLNSAINEYDRIQKLNGERHKENILNFSSELSANVANFHVSIADLFALFDEKTYKESNNDDNDIIVDNKDDNIIDNNNNEINTNDNNNIENENNNNEIIENKNEENKNEENKNEENKDEEKKDEEKKDEEKKDEEKKDYENKNEEKKEEENKNEEKKEEGNTIEEKKEEGNTIEEKKEEGNTIEEKKVEENTIEEKKVEENTIEEKKVEENTIEEKKVEEKKEEIHKTEEERLDNDKEEK